MKITNLIIFLLLSSILLAQKSSLQSGPMVGYSGFFEVMLWVQTKTSAEVKIKYYQKDKPNNFHWTNSVITEKETAFTAKLIADILEVGKVYQYELYINNQKVDLPYETSFQTQKLWRWRTDPPDFSFACGSGTYINDTAFDRPGEPYGGDYQIFNSILKTKPDFMLWLGDNIYLREPDWDTRTGMMYRNTHTRSCPEMQALLASVHNYAIVDDHDLGPNDSDGSFWNKKAGLDAFKLFWANPSFGIEEAYGAISFFTWADVDFILLDNRYHRTPDFRQSGEKTMLGKEQLEWLKNSLSYSNASFKVVVMGGQFLTTAKRYETYINYGFDNERQEIIDFIQKENIKNVVFLDGDRHHTEFSMLVQDKYPTIYDLTVSPLTSHHSSTDPNEEKNLFRVPGTFVGQRNFGKISVTGKFEERVMQIEICDSNGKLLWNREVKQEK